MKTFMKAGAAIVATSYLVHSFCPVYISATNDRLGVGQPADGTTSTGRSWDNVGEARKNPQGVADEERSSNGVEGESKRRSQLYRRPSTGFFSNQSGTLQKLLTAALLSMGMFSAVRMGKELMSGPPSDEDAVRSHSAAPLAGLPSRSLPHGLIVAALTLLVVASSLAAPLPSGDAARSEKATSGASPTIGFFHKGKYFNLKFSDKDVAHYKITRDDLKQLERALNETPREIVNKEKGVRESFWGGVTVDPEFNRNLVGFFHLGDGRQNYLTVPGSVSKCEGCLKEIHKLGDQLRDYDTLLSSNDVEKFGKVGPASGLKRVEYQFVHGRAQCFIGGSPDDDDYEKGNVAMFSLGDTDFRVLLPGDVIDALAGKAGNGDIVGSLDPKGELQADLVHALSRPPTLVALPTGTGGDTWQPRPRGDMGDLDKFRRPERELKWGGGENKVTVHKWSTAYTVGLPPNVLPVLRKAQNFAPGFLQELYDLAFPQFHAAILREKMTKQ